jgi:hypothetical protein
MTRGVQIYSKSEFSEWIRKYGPSSEETEDAVDIQDIDFVVFSYLTGDLMTIEAKERNGKVKGAQLDTQNVLRQLLMYASESSTVNTKRGIRPIKYHGHHLIQFQNTTPDNGLTKIDGNLVTREDLIKFINFGRELKNNDTKET